MGKISVTKAASNAINAKSMGLKPTNAQSCLASATRKGFHRRYNLLEHQKRAHGVQPSGLFRASYSTADEISQSDGSTTMPECEIGAEALNGEEVDSAAEMRGDINANSRQDIRAKLRALLNMRAELDEDIRSMERAVSIMYGESP